MVGPWESTWCLSVAETAGKNTLSGAVGLFKQARGEVEERNSVHRALNKDTLITFLKISYLLCLDWYKAGLL